LSIESDLSAPLLRLDFRDDAALLTFVTVLLFIVTYGYGTPIRGMVYVINITVTELLDLFLSIIVAFGGATEEFRLRMKGMVKQDYAASFTSERLLLLEVEIVLRLLADGLSWAQVRHEVLARNLFQARRTSTAQTYLTLVKRRIDWLDEPLQSLYLKGDRNDTMAILLYTFLASYRFPREFVLEELRHAFQIGMPLINERQVFSFLERKREQHPEVAHWTATSQKKVSQVMLRILRECTLLEAVPQGWKVHPLVISTTLSDYVTHEHAYRHFQSMILVQ